MADKNNEIFSEKVHSSKRSYFFDVCKTSQGKYYIKIQESIKRYNEFERHRLMVFEEDINAFDEAYQKIMKFICDNKKSG